MRINQGDTERTVGYVVDTVSDVYNIRPDSVRQPPDFGTRVDTSFVQGLVNVEDKMVIILSVDELAAEEEL